jgi:hypothetical protein
LSLEELKGLSSGLKAWFFIFKKCKTKRGMKINSQQKLAEHNPSNHGLINIYKNYPGTLNASHG